MNKENKLSISFIKKITIDNTEYQKEFVIKRKKGSYALEVRDGIRYIIFKEPKSMQIFDKGKIFTIIARKMGGNKYKNYFMGHFAGPIPELKDHLKAMLDKTTNHKQKFNQYIKSNFGIDYDNSAS